MIPVRQSCLTLPPPAPPSEIGALDATTPLTDEQLDAVLRWAAEQSTYAETAWVLCGPAPDGATP